MMHAFHDYWGRARDRARPRKSGENAERTSPIRRFNDLTFRRITRRQPVLELGSVPLPVVTARIDRFIAEGGKGPYPDMEEAVAGGAGAGSFH